MKPHSVSLVLILEFHHTSIHLSLRRPGARPREGVGSLLWTSTPRKPYKYYPCADKNISHTRRGLLASTIPQKEFSHTIEFNLAYSLGFFHSIWYVLKLTQFQRHQKNNNTNDRPPDPYPITPSLVSLVPL